ncbi:type I-C CRISPR-associated protein Cas8c/Csd1 [Amycolatopsis cynarae]|uniref:Type I-C CRISPR-associated protein Cas8c/Csd1 n=1 Tax=Amycolatopsis cynarae TaxID=2995223 RepID=A0ABY7AVQ9_9PSEU|nr:type I-C CRISPR-associated protein Cas8c/Csd1 [Amycolatopsis sp. HUAS 11-8]WAL63770.1 type I-C CRISPR-associated protein Cas8c/Csd1 [Amycolatopsis sp. HUAS 11-8]
MLLQRLVEYASRDPEAKPFHRSRQFQWELRIDQQGKLLSAQVESLLTNDIKGKPRGADHVVPATVRTVGVAPNLAADDVQYVLGWSDADTRPERVAQCHQAFVDLIYRWAESPEGRDDSVAQAVAAFYRSGGLTSLPRDDSCTAKQGVLITVVDDSGGRVPAYRAPSVVPFWSGEVAQRKGGNGQGLCLVCGKIRPLLETVPGKVPGRLVPGASNDAALVSINERVFGYDLTTQLGCSPICISCGEAVSAGLGHVLSSSYSTSYGGQDSRLAWWTTEDVPSNPMLPVFDAAPEDVNALLASPRRGRFEDDELDEAMFCALTVGGNVARVMVRDWLEMPLGELRAHIVAWFADHQMTPLFRQENEYHSLQRFVLVTGRWLRREKRYAPIGAKGADRPDNVQRDLLRAAMRGTPLPPSLLAHLVHRVQTDGRLDTPRASLIRLALMRSPLMKENVMPGLDPNNTDPAYVSGRIFAALEALQYDASGGKLNTTYADRYFAGAITNPRAALVNGRKDAKAWLRKLRGNRRGAAVNHEKTLDSLFELLPAEAIPARASLKQQSLFLLGYHHQRAHRFAALGEAKPTTEEIPA